MKSNSLNIDHQFVLPKKDVHVWSFSAATSRPELEEKLQVLAQSERVRASKYRFDKDRSVYITGRHALRMLLARYLERVPQDIVFRYTPYEKPIYDGPTDIIFNVSHSETQIVIAFTKHPGLGVDIEKIKNDFDTLELAENFFSKEEIRALSAFDEVDRHMAFFRCWTRKESFIKAVGQGLSYPLDSFAVSMDDDFRAEFLKIDGIPAQENNWKLHSFVPAEGYIAAISTNGQPDTIQFYNGSGII